MVMIAAAGAQPNRCIAALEREYDLNALDTQYFGPCTIDGNTYALLVYNAKPAVGIDALFTNVRLYAMGTSDVCIYNLETGIEAHFVGLTSTSDGVVLLLAPKANSDLNMICALLLSTRQAPMYPSIELGRAHNAPFHLYLLGSASAPGIDTHRGPGSASIACDKAGELLVVYSALAPGSIALSAIKFDLSAPFYLWSGVVNCSIQSGNVIGSTSRVDDLLYMKRDEIAYSVNGAPQASGVNFVKLGVECCLGGAGFQESLQAAGGAIIASTTNSITGARLVATGYSYAIDYSGGRLWMIFMRPDGEGTELVLASAPIPVTDQKAWHVEDIRRYNAGTEVPDGRSIQLLVNDNHVTTTVLENVRTTNVEFSTQLRLLRFAVNPHTQHAELISDRISKHSVAVFWDTELVQAGDDTLVSYVTVTEKGAVGVIEQID